MRQSDDLGLTQDGNASEDVITLPPMLYKLPQIRQITMLACQNSSISSGFKAQFLSKTIITEEKQIYKAMVAASPSITLEYKLMFYATEERIALSNGTITPFCLSKENMQILYLDLLLEDVGENKEIVRYQNYIAAFFNENIFLLKWLCDLHKVVVNGSAPVVLFSEISRSLKTVELPIKEAIIMRCNVHGHPISIWMSKEQAVCFKIDKTALQAAYEVAVKLVPAVGQILLA